jgi:hypothetical protein
LVIDHRAAERHALGRPVVGGRCALTAYGDDITNEPRTDLERCRGGNGT